MARSRRRRTRNRQNRRGGQPLAMSEVFVTVKGVAGYTETFQNLTIVQCIPDIVGGRPVFISHITASAVYVAVSATSTSAPGPAGAFARLYLRNEPGVVADLGNSYYASTPLTALAYAMPTRLHVEPRLKTLPIPLIDIGSHPPFLTVGVTSFKDVQVSLVIRTYYRIGQDVGYTVIQSTPVYGITDKHAEESEENTHIQKASSLPSQNTYKFIPQP